MPHHEQPKQPRHYTQKGLETAVTRAQQRTRDLQDAYVRRGEDEAIRSMARVGVEVFEEFLAIHAASEEPCPRCHGTGRQPDLCVRTGDGTCSVCGGV